MPRDRHLSTVRPQPTMATPAERRVRFLFCLNIGVLAVLGPAGLLAPGGVAAHWFGDSRSGATARLMDMSPPSGGSPLLSYQMLGAPGCGGSMHGMHDMPIGWETAHDCCEWQSAREHAVADRAPCPALQGPGGAPSPWCPCWACATL